MQLPTIKSLRACLGGIALGLGAIGLFLFAIGIPFCIFEAHFWAGFGEGPPQTVQQHQAAVDAGLRWAALHRLMPLFLLSCVLIGYGFYEAYKERENKP